MDYIDLLQIHRYDPDTPREETMKALHGTAAVFGDFLILDLVVMGKVRYIGASSMYAYQFLGLQYVAEKNGWTKFISMQNYYNLVYREEEREMLPACKELGVGYSFPGPSHTDSGLFHGLLLQEVFSRNLSAQAPFEVKRTDSLRFSFRKR